MPDAERPCVVLEEGETRSTEIVLDTRVRRADVVIAFEATGSMMMERNALVADLEAGLLDPLARRVPELRVGLAFFSDYPPNGYALDRGVYLTRVTSDLSTVASHVGFFELEDGGDAPEAQTLALHDIVAGRPTGSDSPCVFDELGGACLNRTTPSYVLLLSDSPFHNGPDGAYPYGALIERPVVQGFEQTMQELRRRHTRVLGISSATEEEAHGHLVRVAVETGAVVDGEALVARVPASGEGIATRALEVLERALDGLPMELTALQVDDARLLVRGVRGIRAEPDEGAEIRGNAVRLPNPGAHITFEVDLRHVGAPGREEIRIELRDHAELLIDDASFCVELR